MYAAGLPLQPSSPPVLVSSISPLVPMSPCPRVPARPSVALRFPLAAPFDRWIDLFNRASEPLICIPCQLANWSTGQLTYPILHTLYSRLPLLHLCTRLRRICTFALGLLISGPRASRVLLRPSCPLVLRPSNPPHVPLSPCQLVPSRSSSPLAARDDAAQLLHRRPAGIDRRRTGVSDGTLVRVVGEDLRFLGH